MTDTATTPVLEFTSHIAGKNAKVRVYRDRIEWDRKSLLGTGGKAVLAAGTAGLSYFATGVTGKRDTEMIPIKSISSITTKKGVLNTLMTFITTGNTIEMNVSHSEAVKVKDLVQTLMLTGDAPAQAPELPTADARQAAAAPTDITVELQKFAALRDQGVITSEDFEAKKRQLLGL
ncbi:SHOCT domain-containing protein [Agrococcus lahaulensis]|uniref:SHOCT domain-containing protein n=1 Tax=Agrococcus lahaulensis TaxID=341722 RepID=UPI00047ABAAB|nr:SHOCT domain-containing protein [Agrococcus lahaulensis]